MDPSIFDNPAFSGMSPEKMQFLLAFAQKDKPKNMKDVMPFLLSNMKAAKEKQLDFSKPEIQIICDILCKDLPKAEQDKVQKIMALMSMGKP